MSEQTTTTITLDRFTRGILCALTVLLTIIAIELWVGRPDGVPTARAQIPDTALQRREIVEETRRTNVLLGQILEHLKTKPVQVTIKADERKPATRPGPRVGK
ncbi:MAG: hypothetical protein HS101_04030 [Planctomycetia bacterium]|jgi:hypothetical protein|nr:hypothetical protein [Planctomycetia bacterium]MCC7313543.1 hypothetical protein [Planctomycetota bacterium]OQY99516.1 MAG: hypothetical protein B6D36_16190 [Planctomycetes bacterium UTPLA1]